MAKRKITVNVDGVNEPVAELYELLFPNGKRYWGYTIEGTPNRFKNGHVATAKRGSDIILSRAIRKYGPENIKVFVRAIGPFSYIRRLEIEAIRVYKTTDFRFGYNITSGGDGVIAFWMTDGKVNKKLGFESEPPTGWRRGRTLAKEHSDNIAEANKRPEVTERKSWIFSKLMPSLVWITNGDKNRRVPKDFVLDYSWRYGRTTSDAHRMAVARGVATVATRAKMVAAWQDPVRRAARIECIKTGIANSEAQAKKIASFKKTPKERPLMWITDGTNSTKHRTSEIIPEGWRRGRK